MAKDPQTVATLWAQRLGAATNEITAGVNAVTVSPGQKAAAAADKWIQNTTAARDKFIRNTNAVTLGAWQTAMIQKGVPRVATGAQQAIPKMAQFMAQWLPFMDQVGNTVRAMPNNTPEDAIARMVAQVRGAMQFQYKKNG